MPLKILLDKCKLPDGMDGVCERSVGNSRKSIKDKMDAISGVDYAAVSWAPPAHHFWDSADLDRIMKVLNPV